MTACYLDKYSFSNLQKQKIFKNFEIKKKFISFVKTANF